MSYKVFIDFEMAPIPKKYHIDKKLCRMEIIQIGAVMLDEEDKEVANFKRNISPDYISELPGYLIDLLGLAYEDLAWRCKLTEALSDFTEWAFSYSDDLVVYAWSNSDYNQVVGEITVKNIDISEKFLSLLGSWYDLQEEFDHIIGSKNNTGLKKALELCGIKFEGKEHDSLIDSRNTAQVYRESRNPGQIIAQIERTKKYTEQKTNFECSLGSMIDFSKLLLSL